MWRLDNSDLRIWCPHEDTKDSVTARECEPVPCVCRCGLTGEETVWLFDGVCHNTECDCCVSRQWMIPYISYHTDWPGHYHDHHMLHNAQCNPTTDIHLSTKLNLSSWNLLPGKHRFGNGSHPQLSYPGYSLIPSDSKTCAQQISESSGGCSTV